MKPTADPDPEELLSAARTGNGSALGRLLEGYRRYLTLLARYWGEERFYHHTAPITMVYALREGLRIALEEGMEARWNRHLRHHPQDETSHPAGALPAELSQVAIRGHAQFERRHDRIPHHPTGRCVKEVARLR